MPDDGSRFQNAPQRRVQAIDKQRPALPPDLDPGCTSRGALFDKQAARRPWQIAQEDSGCSVQVRVRAGDQGRAVGIQTDEDSRDGQLAAVKQSQLAQAAGAYIEVKGSPFGICTGDDGSAGTG